MANSFCARLWTSGLDHWYLHTKRRTLVSARRGSSVVKPATYVKDPQNGMPLTTWSRGLLCLGPVVGECYKGQNAVVML